MRLNKALTCLPFVHSSASSFNRTHQTVTRAFGIDAAGGQNRNAVVKTAPKTLDKTKLFGFAQVEKVKSQDDADRLIDRSSKIGTENGDKVLWSKIGNTEG